ncbi:MAG TPA: hypothetical protein VMV45_10720, partial [Casimicrobiaceae bacterium]|nr:hypothetical protein [Casimicrobiaceae bacterium]
GPGDMRGPWNQGPQWEFIDGAEAVQPAGGDGGDGSASVKLNKEEESLGENAAMRRRSDLDSDPMTGADLGAGPGAGSTTGESANGSDEDMPELTGEEGKRSARRTSGRSTGTRRGS